MKYRGSLSAIKELTRYRKTGSHSYNLAPFTSPLIPTGEKAAHSLSPRPSVLFKINLSRDSFCYVTEKPFCYSRVLKPKVHPPRRLIET